MLLFENIQLALNGLRANKMRALLTMLGIIIGIGSVIAIMTVAGSMTNSITTSMQSMGANNITVSLTQKSDSDYTEGAQTRMFRPTTPGAEDLLTDEMLADYRALYGGSIYAVSLTQSLGSYTVSTNADEAGVNGGRCERRVCRNAVSRAGGHRPGVPAHLRHQGIHILYRGGVPV